MNNQMDANELINGLLGQVGDQAKEVAMLKVQLVHALNQIDELTKQVEPVEEVVDDGSDTV